MFTGYIIGWVNQDSRPPPVPSAPLKGNSKFEILLV